VPQPARWRAVAAALLTAAAGTGCSDDGNDITTPPPPSSDAVHITSVSASANPTNVLAASVAVVAEHADSARLLFAPPGAPPDSTPVVSLTGGQASIPVLGLRSGVSYSGVVEALGTSDRARSDSVRFAAGALPEPLQQVTFTTAGTGTTGYTLAALALGGGSVFAIAFDSSGAIRWYRGFSFPTAQATGDLKQQANGNFTLFLGTTTGSEPVPGGYVEFAPTGDSLRTIAAPDPLFTDNHELTITGSGTDERMHLFGYDRRVTDLSSLGGPAAAEIAGHTLLRLRPDGTSEFTWSGWDHFGVEEWIEPPPPDPTNMTQPDFDHPNAVSLDQDGNYIVSWRNLGAVIKIDAQSGETIWRLGGANNEFTFVNDPFNGFSAQHYARILPNGHLLLYDNGTRHQPSETRVVEYALDIPMRTATLVWEFRHAPPIYTAYVGSVQRLVSGNTAIGYGFVGHATEVAPDGSVVWEADLQVDGAPILVYRLTRIASLYRFQDP
jgi:hypothetical protein